MSSQGISLLTGYEGAKGAWQEGSAPRPHFGRRERMHPGNHPDAKVLELAAWQRLVIPEGCQYRFENDLPRVFRGSI